jgi:hypothetical protein
LRVLSTDIDAQPRALLFFFAVLIQLSASAVSGAGFVLNNPYMLFTGTIVWVGWFIVVIWALLPLTDTRLKKYTRFLERGAVTIFTTLFVLGLLEVMVIAFVLPGYLSSADQQKSFPQLMGGLDTVFKYNDSTALCQQAAENLLDGENPYAGSNIILALEEFHGAYDRVTPLQAGTFTGVFPYPSQSQLKQVYDRAILNHSLPPVELESKMCYPAGSFVLPAPFIAMGITDIRVVYALFVLAGLGYAVWILPKKRRFAFIGVALISLELWNSVAGGETGSLVFPLLLVAWLMIDRNIWLSAFFMGLAVSTKQTAWFFLIFYAILILRVYGLKKIAAVIGIIAVIFLGMNLPFILMDAPLWLSSIMSPMIDRMFPVGSGIITLVTGSFIYIQEQAVFTAMEMSALGVGVVWYFVYCKRYPQTGPILSVIPLFFAWRSLWCYFFYVALISLAFILAGDKFPRNQKTANFSRFLDIIQ